MTNDKLKEIQQWINKNKYYIIIFFTMLIISILVPLSGDDLGNFNPDTNIIYSLKNAYHSYFTYESRVASRILINLLCYYKIIWAFLNAFAVLIIYRSIIKVLDIKGKVSYMLLGIGILGIPCAMFGQVYAWVTGSITYLFPTAIILGYYTYIMKDKKKDSIINLSILSLINIIAPMFIDHCGVAIILANVIIIVDYFINNKKISKIYLVYLMISIIAMLIVYFAPGNANRLATTEKFATMSILEKICFNYSKFIDYIYYANPLLMILMMVPINYLIMKKIKKNILLKALIIIVINIIPFMALSYELYLYNPFINYTSSLDFYWPDPKHFLNSGFVYFYWTIICFLYLASIYFIVKDNKKKIKNYYYFIVIGLAPNIAMLLSPTWGFRTTYFTNIVLIGISVSLIINIIKINEYQGEDVKIIVPIIYYTIIIYIISNFVLVAHFDKVRLTNIQKQYDNGSRNIIIKTCPLRYMWNYNPYMDFHNDAYRGLLVYKKIIKDKNITLQFEQLENYRNVIKGWD